MISKKVFIPIMLATALLGTTVFGRGLVMAQSKTNYFSGFVQAIAQKFNLDQGQVQAVADDYKKSHNPQTDRLSKLVSDGKITEVQKQAIVTEMTALKAKYNIVNLKNLTVEQRKAQRQAEKDEITAWAKANGIDLSYLMFGQIGGMGRGFGRRMMN